MKLFNRDGQGAEEIVQVLGLIDQDLEWSKWEPILPLAIREVEAMAGADVVAAIDQCYQSGVAESDQMHEVVRLAQQTVAMFAWLKVIPTLDAQHGTAGRAKHLGENETGMTAVQEFKDEENIRNMAYSALDAMLSALNTANPEWWQKSQKKALLDRLLIRSLQQFDEFYTIGSHRLFLVLIPMMSEVQEVAIVPVIGRARMKMLLEGSTELPDYLLPMVQRPLALLTMKRAVERLPIEVLPDGIVQVQQQGMVRDRAKAENQARLSVAQNLGRDAEEFLNLLSNEIQQLNAEASGEPAADCYVPEPSATKAGMTF